MKPSGKESRNLARSQWQGMHRIGFANPGRRKCVGIVCHNERIIEHYIWKDIKTCKTLSQFAQIQNISGIFTSLPIKRVT
jgi:hypothetical protein